MRIRRTVHLYVYAVVGLAMAGLAYDMWATEGHRLLGPDPAALFVLAACGLAAELFPLRWLGRGATTEVTGSWTFMMAILMIATPIVTVSLAAVMLIAADLKARKTPLKIAFNASQIIVALSLAAAVFGVFHQADQLQQSSDPDLAWFPVAAAACAVAFVANSVLTSSVLALQQRVSLRAVLGEQFTGALPTDGLLMLLSPIFVVAAERSLLLVPPLLVMTMFVFRTARLALTRQHEATHDLLTSLANRRLFHRHLDDTLEAAGRNGTKVALVMIDLDGFKAVNDGLGHQVGDSVLGAVAARLAGACRPGDLLARLGGDEFALVVPRLASAEAAAEVAHRLLAIFEKPFTAEGFPVALRASAGVAVYPDDGDGGDLLLRRADEAMYSAKSTKSGVCLYRSQEDHTRIGRVGLLSDLNRAMDADELFLEFQPQVALSDGDVVGVEALLRWQHPTVGRVQPNAFMPLAEQTELIGPITEWVLNGALQEAARLGAGDGALRMSINVSVRNLEEPEFPRLVRRALDAAALPPSSLLLEVADNTAALDRAPVRQGIIDLRDLGVGLAIDDFGTGNSSIIQLRDLPVDQIKLDSSFVATMAHGGRDALIVRAMLQLAGALDLQTVAEGVEERLVSSLLKDLGCQQAQGFLFARPMTAAELDDWLVRRDWTVPAPAAERPRQPS